MRNEKFISFLEKGIQNFSQEETKKHLGDRTTYIGSSDIGQCPRKVFFSKNMPQEHSLQQNMIFLRGHLAENIIKAGFSGNKIQFEEQFEVEGKDQYRFVRTHIDFLIHLNEEEKIIVECKSVNTIPKTPYESWVLQTQLQMGLLKENNFPIKRGIIAVINVNTGELEAFELQFSQELFNVALKRAEMLWEALKNNREPFPEKGNLCSYCQVKASCPALKGENLPEELEVLAVTYNELQKQQKSTSNEVDAIKKQIIDFMSATGIHKAKVNNLMVSYSVQKGKVLIDQKALKEKFPEIYESLKTYGKDYEILKIS
ncbi:Dna2/Cas4 domain-containing protein [Helicobacter equorum]|uniref:DUF83 domain-containing protein n=1 Tax=Helicobacter equorum TaxID=361872 RepID=A0A3D8IMH4_9HELI|nr:Dna2/Cas4 domain-containing protein [Helicobacter equorum]RDU66487.1 hypothetical protein CQA54_07240 [Helicobacter equorum]